MVTIETDFNTEGFEEEIIRELNLFPIGKTELETIADIVIDDIREGIDTGKDLTNASFIPNTPQWQKRKGNTKVMLGKTGGLYASFKKNIIMNGINDFIIEIIAKGNGLYWQITPHGKWARFKRDFFGVSERALTKIQNYLDSKFGQ